EVEVSGIEMCPALRAPAQRMGLLAAQCYIPRMTREEVITRIRKHADAIRAEGATALWLFGSTARGDAGPDSDIDVLVDLDPGRRISLLHLIGMKHIIEGETGRSVDVVDRRSVPRPLRPDIESEAIRIF